MAVCFIDRENCSTQRITDLSQFTDKLLSHNVVSSTPHQFLNIGISILMLTVLTQYNKMLCHVYFHSLVNLNV